MKIKPDDIDVDLKIKFYWFKPPENATERIMRKQANAIMARKAMKIAEEIRKNLSIEVKKL